MTGKSQCWTEWAEHFESVVTVNKWDSDDDKLKWLKVRLTGKARTAFQKLPADVRNKYGECVKALKQRFEPDSKKQLVLADKAYSDLEEKARERLVLSQFLAHIGNPQVAFGVRQKRPETVEAAVLATIELESYLNSCSIVECKEAPHLSRLQLHQTVLSPISEALKQLNERLDKLEVLVLIQIIQSGLSWILHDASNYGIGAVLSQISNDGSECVIAYASRSLSRQEQRYCVTQRELLAIVEFVQHFRQYLLGRQFRLRTDHGSLVWVRNFKEPEGQLARWLERLEEYDFTVIHRRGSQHSNADALSRGPCKQCGRSSHFHNGGAENAVTGAVTDMHFQTCSTEEMRHLQQR
eukprot:Em0005g1004a